MAIYKRYNTRRKRINYPLIIWACVMLLVLIATVIVGHVLGQKAEGGESYMTGDVGAYDDGETLASVIPHIMQAVYVEPKELSAFTTEDTSVYASTWLFRDGEPCFASGVASALGEDVSRLPAIDSFNISCPISGMFEVGSIYAEESVRGVLFEYEKALAAEFSGSGPDETVLVFNTLTEDNFGEVVTYAKDLGGAVIAVPYTALYEGYFVRFLTEATESGFTVALMADGLSREQLATDIEDYAVYFTRDFMRIMLSGEDAGLADVLREKNILNYQFYS